MSGTLCTVCLRRRFPYYNYVDTNSGRGSSSGEQDTIINEVNIMLNDVIQRLTPKHFPKKINNYCDFSPPVVHRRHPRFGLPPHLKVAWTRKGSAERVSTMSTLLRICENNCCGDDRCESEQGVKASKKMKRRKMAQERRKKERLHTRGQELFDYRSDSSNERIFRGGLAHKPYGSRSGT
jgi:hypothetical protein